MPVKTWRSRLDYSKLPKVRAWNVEINENMMEVDGRILQPPTINYGGNKRISSKEGSWNLANVSVSTLDISSITTR